MALIPCPACGLPRAADADTHCPACRWAESYPAPPEPTAPSPAPPLPPALEAVRPGNRVVAAVLGIAVGVVATLALQEFARRPESPPPEPEPEATDTAPVYPRVASLPVAPPPRLVELGEGDAIVLHLPVLVPVDPSGGFAVLKIDQPDELYQFPRLDGGNKVKLVGRVKRLTVAGVEGGSELDATGLECDAVGVSGAIDGGSTLRVKASGGTVSIRGGVRGGSVVEVDAPKAYTTFAGGNGSKAGPTVGGGSRVTLRVKAAVFDASLFTHHG